jgi:hypothetical protein
MTVQEILLQCEAHGVTLAPGQNGAIRVSPPGVLPDKLRKALQEYRGSVLRLLSAPPADVMSDEPCDVCESRERWHWFDGRLRCRVCLVLDLVPMTLGPVSEREENSCSHGTK